MPPDRSGGGGGGGGGKGGRRPVALKCAALCLATT